MLIKIAHIKTFQKIIKPSFTEKQLKIKKKNLIKNDNVISEESELAEMLRNYFENTVKMYFKHI